MYNIGIDLGGTNIAAGIVDENGQILIKHSVPTYKERPTDEIVADMASLAKKLIAESGLNITEFSSVGIGCPGTIDSKSGEVVYSNNIPMEHYPMAQRFKEHLNLPVIIDNDANCAALGEYTVNGNEAKVFILITLGTGVGSGVIINGKIFHGFNGAAAELGHITLVSGGKNVRAVKKVVLKAMPPQLHLLSRLKLQCRQIMTVLCTKLQRMRARFRDEPLLTLPNRAIILRLRLLTIMPVILRTELSVLKMLFSLK